MKEDSQGTRNSSHKRYKDIEETVEIDFQNCQKYLKEEEIPALISVINKNVKLLQALKMFVKNRENRLQQNQNKNLIEKKDLQEKPITIHKNKKEKAVKKQDATEISLNYHKF